MSKPDTINKVPVDNELTSIKSPEQSEKKDLSRRDERVLAFHFLYAAEQSDYQDSLESIVALFQAEFELDIPSTSFAITLAQGTIQERTTLDSMIVPFLKNWKLERLGLITRLILRLAIWELKNTDVASSVVINEAIELAKGFAEKDAYKFINGILDEFIKVHRKEEKKHIETEDGIDSKN